MRFTLGLAAVAALVSGESALGANAPALHADFARLEADLASLSTAVSAEKTAAPADFASAHVALATESRALAHASVSASNVQARQSSWAGKTTTKHTRPASGASSGIEMVFLRKAGVTGVFPSIMDTWKPTYTPIPMDEEDNVNKLAGYIEHWRSQYPYGNIGSLVKQFIVAKGVALDGAPFGGFYYYRPGATLWLAESTINRDEYVQTLHHEVAHLLEEQLGGGWLEKEWNKLLPSGWKWKGQCGSDCSRDYNPSLWSKGFLTGYNQVSFAEDFAQWANALISGHRNLWDAVEKYPNLMKKVDLVVKVYAKLDSRYTRAYFRGLKTNDLKRFASNEAIMGPADHIPDGMNMHESMMLAYNTQRDNDVYSDRVSSTA